MTKKEKRSLRFKRLRARILRNSRVVDETGCRLWTARLNNQGYPVMNVFVPDRGVVKMIATRVSLEVFLGPPPIDGNKYEAAHDVECPHRHCVEVEHLRWATRSENEADKRHPSRLRLREVYPPVHVLEAETA